MSDEGAAGPPPEGARGDVETVEPSRLQQAHARRVAESKATVPHLYLEAEAGVDQAPAKPEMVVRACALALRQFPLVNGAYRDGRFELYSRINIGVAVAAQGTLLFPTIHDADRKDLATIAAETQALGARARDATITQPELSAGTFSVADLRPQGITRSSAVIRGGQAAIMAVGAAGDDGPITLSLACDNRILQGLEGAEFLARVKALLEEPGALAL